MLKEHLEIRHSIRPRISRLGLASVIFFTVSGGAYGLEPLVGSLGAGWAVAFIALAPLLWCLPVAAMVSELSSMMPEEGGYYAWVREGLGEFWGFQEGWWTLCYTAVDMAIYPVLFVDYLGYFYPSLQLPAHHPAALKVSLLRWLVALAVIGTAFFINWRGIHLVGKSSVLTLILVLSPFALLTIIGFSHPGAMGHMFSAIRTGLAHGHSGHLLALGVAIVLWNYSGWDNVSTFAAEVKDAPRAYPFALVSALLLIAIAYVLPVLAGIGTTTSPALWSESAGWPEIARAVAGNWLAIAVAAMGVISAWSMFNSQLLYISRLPYAMARDGWFPPIFAKISLLTGVPVAALVVTCVVAGFAAAFPFTKLVVIDILLYSTELLLEFLALIVLRAKKPQAERPFRIPGGWPGVILATVLPMGLALVVALTTAQGSRTGLEQLLVVPAVILSGFLIYFMKRGAIRRAV